MHDVDRDSLFGEVNGSKKKHAKKASKKHDHKKHGDDDHTAQHDHDEEIVSKYPGFEHRHVHEDDEEHEHHHHTHGDEHNHEHNHNHDEDNEFHGHDHDYNHDEEEYHNHEYEDEHHHNHPREAFADRAFEHVHEHGHQLLHSHHHVHHEEESSVLHRLFRNPARDWFAFSTVGILIVLSRFGIVGKNLENGFLVMASVIGIFPLVKNSVIIGITKRKITAELIVSLFLIIALFYGKIFYVSITVLLILLGSFLRLDFSWKK